MLDSTLELLTLAASNSLVVFCFCNLIIAILLVGSFKPSSEVDDEEKPSTHSLPRIVQRNEDSRSFENNEGSTGKTEVLREMNVTAPAEEVIEAPSINIDVVDDGQESQDEEDDDLRRRIEEFIAKVNRGWKAEKLRTHALVH